MKLSRVLCAAGLAALMAGCSTIDANHVEYLGAPHYAPTTPEMVTVFFKAADAPKTYERLGEITLSASVDPAPSNADLEKALRKQAARMGANGVIVTVDRAGFNGVDISGPYFARRAETEAGHRIVATAIHYAH